MENQERYCQKCDKWLDKESDYTKIEKEGHREHEYIKCNDCGEEIDLGGSINTGNGCGFCFKPTNKHIHDKLKKGPNYYKRIVKEHDYDEKTDTWTINHECKARCQTCEETKPIEEMLIGISFYFGDVSYCDSCCWKDMKEEEKQTYEGCANSHVAQERRTYQRYLKLKNKFSDEDPSNSRRKRAEIKQLQADIQQLESITNRTAQQEKDLQNKKKQLADLVNNPQQNNPTNSPNKSNKGLYIGLAIAAGLLVIGIIAYFLLRNKNKKDYD